MDCPKCCMCGSPAIWEYTCYMRNRNYCSEECKMVEHDSNGKKGFCTHSLDKKI